MHALNNVYHMCTVLIVAQDVEAAESYTATTLAEHYRKSREWKKLEESLKSAFKMQPHVNTTSTTEGTYVTSLGRQVCICLECNCVILGSSSL